MEKSNDQLMFYAMQLEDKLFEDMTLEGYPSIFETLDEWGTYVRPSVESVRFYTLEDNGETFGIYNKRDMSIGLVEGADVVSLAHEMIHYYEHALDELNPSLRQLLAIDLWGRLEGQIADLRERMVRHLELVGLREHENDGGTHDLLFALKSYDIDLRLNCELGTTYGYGGRLR